MNRRTSESGRTNRLLIRTLVPHTGPMDLTHTHLEFGYLDGCEACEQLIRDLARCRLAAETATVGILDGGRTRLRVWHGLHRQTRDELLSNPNKVDSLLVG